MKYWILVLGCFVTFEVEAQKHVLQLGLGMNSLASPDGNYGVSASAKYLNNLNKFFVAGVETSYNGGLVFDLKSHKSLVFSALIGTNYKDSNVNIRFLSGLSFIEGTYSGNYIQSTYVNRFSSREQIKYSSWSIPIEAQVFINLNGKGSGLVLSFARHISTKRPFNVVSLAYQFALGKNNGLK